MIRQRMIRNITAIYLSDRGFNIGLVLLLILMALPLFGHLGGLVIRQWDEARLSVNAWEMMKSGNLLVTTYQNEPDLWNTKPPLLIWFQALLLYFIDQPELAMRIPSAIAALMTMLLLYFFIHRVTGNIWLAFSSALILLTSGGYTAMHAARAGDYDATLVLFTTFSALAFWLFTETGKQKFIYLACFGLALGVLTKSINALLFIPGFFVYLLYRRQLVSLLKNKSFYIGLFIFLLPVASYYLLREWAAPGYLKAVGENELWGRYLDVIENHKQDRWFYYHNLIDLRFKAYYLLVPLGIIAGLLTSGKQIQRLIVFLGIVLITFFAVITAGQTKLFWYDLPMFPFLSILAATGISSLIHFATKLKWINKVPKMTFILPMIFILVFTLKPFQKAIERTNRPKETYWEKDTYIMSYYLRDALKGKHSLQDIYVLYDGYNTMMKVYISLLREKGVNTEYKYYKSLQAGDRVVTYQPQIIEYLEGHFETDLLYTYKETNTYHLISKR